MAYARSRRRSRNSYRPKRRSSYKRRSTSRARGRRVQPRELKIVIETAEPSIGRLPVGAAPAAAPKRASF